MKSASLWGASSWLVISTASYSNFTGLLEKNSLPRCDSDCDNRVTGEGSLAIVPISRVAVYLVAVVIESVVAVVAAVVVAAVNMDTVVVVPIVASIVVAVVVATLVMQSRLRVVVVVLSDSSQSMMLLRITAM